jgi:hypothetical protein
MKSPAESACADVDISSTTDSSSSSGGTSLREMLKMPFNGDSNFLDTKDRSGNDDVDDSLLRNNELTVLDNKDGEKEEDLKKSAALKNDSKEAEKTTDHDTIQGVEGDGLCFHSVRKQQLMPKRCAMMLQEFQKVCTTSDFQEYSSLWGLVSPGFELNSYAVPGNPVYDRFCDAFQKLPDTAKLAVVFHGTSEKNVPVILKEGLDPNLRKGQAYGPGEYFSVEPGMSSSYCRLGNKMLVFVVVVPSTVPPTAPTPDSKGPRKHVKPPPDIVVVPTIEHQLPLGVLCFASVSHAALQRSRGAKLRLQRLSEELRRKTQQAEISKVKARIIQLLITSGMDVASEVYIKNKDTLDVLTKKEISMWAHRSSDADFVSYYFPDLPEPMTGVEHTAAAIKTVDALEEDVAAAKKELDRERLNPLSVAPTFLEPFKITGKRLENGEMVDYTPTVSKGGTGTTVNHSAPSLWSK